MEEDEWSLNNSNCAGMHYTHLHPLELLLGKYLSDGLPTDGFVYHVMSQGSITNCYSPEDPYWPREKIDKKIQNIQKGKVFILHGPLGTGKSFSVLHFIDNARNKFMSWRVNLSKDEEGIRSCLDELAEKLNVKTDKKYSLLFQAIKKRAEKEKKKVIFFLEKMQEMPNSIWFKELLRIKDSLYIIGTSNNASLGYDFADAEMIPVDRFEEAEAFLKDSKEIKDENSDEALQKLCEYFSWNVLGLTAAKAYIFKTKTSVEAYLEMLHEKESAFVVRKAEQRVKRLTTTLYIATRTSIEVEKDRFSSLAIISLIAYCDVPEFLLSNMFLSSSSSSKCAHLNDLQFSLLRKSLVYVTKEDKIRLFSFHKFTQSVIRDLLEEELPGMPKKKELINKMTGILVKYFNKDNRFRKEAFMQRILLNHAEQLLQHVKDTDDRSTIALARLSELVGFAYTQTQPKTVNSSYARFQRAEAHFQRAEKALHRLCGITDDFQVMLCQDNDTSPSALVGRAETLFEKLSEKSSKLSNEDVFELAFSRPFSSTDLSLFPSNVRENEEIKKKVDTFEPFLKEDLELLENNGLAYTVDDYRELFLPELYASIVYSFGRNYFYQSNKMAIPNPNSFTNRLKLAHLISSEVSRRMKPGEAVLHEYLTQANALLYLLVNAEEVTKDNCVKPKAPKQHCQDLASAVSEYQNLIEQEMCYFEMGILKKKNDKYGKLRCHCQILLCYKKLIAPKMTTTSKERDEYIRDGVRRCETLMQWLNVYSENDTTETFGSDLENAGKHLNIIGEFLLVTEQDAYLSRAWTAFVFSAKHEERKEGARSPVYLQAVVGLANVFSRCGRRCFVAAQVSNLHLKHLISEKNFQEFRCQQPDIDKEIRNITIRNIATFASYNAKSQRSVSPHVTSDGDLPNKTFVKPEPVLPVSNTFVKETIVGKLNVVKKHSCCQTETESRPRKERRTEPGPSSEFKSPFSSPEPSSVTMVRQIPYLQRRKICELLNVKLCVGDDFQTLAGHVGMSASKVKLVCQKEDPADEVLSWWETQNSATVQRFQEILKIMKRDDALDIVNEI